MSYNYISYTDIGLKRTDNEDALGVFETDSGVLAVVCDGLGGNKAGDVASKLTVEIIHKEFISSTERDYLEKIRSAILKANSIVIETSNSNIDMKGMATTVEVLFIKGNTAYWGHVGDSRIYIIKNGKIKQLTKDHSLVQKLVDEGYLTLKEAENHPNKNIIMRALGDNQKIDIDLSKLKFNSFDDLKFFMCTDGVSGVLKDQELEKMISMTNMKELPEVLSAAIKEKGAPDNFSFVIITL